MHPAGERPDWPGSPHRLGSGSRDCRRKWSAALLRRRRYNPSVHAPVTLAYPARQLWP